MSGKRINPMEYPPTASSSDEDEETSIGQGEEVNSSSEEEEGVSLAVSSKKLEKEQVPDSESGSDEESESDSEPVRKSPVAKPEPVVAAKPVTKKQDSKKVKALEKPGSKKRSSETNEGGDAKKVKRISGEEEEKKSEETKKGPFNRVWSEEDEIAVLEGYIEYKKVNSNDDQNAFYLSVKKSISFDVSKVQFMEKFRGLKRKFEKNIAKGKNGEEPIFGKAHDKKAFGLSKLIWGANGLAPESAVKSNGQAKKSTSKSKSKEEIVSSLLRVTSQEEEETTKGKGLLKSLARFGVDDLSAQQGWGRLNSEDKKRFEEQWEALQAKEFEFYTKRSGLVHEVVTKMAEAFQSNP